MILMNLYPLKILNYKVNKLLSNNKNNKFKNYKMKINIYLIKLIIYNNKNQFKLL